SASMSNLLGVAVTPLLVLALMTTNGSVHISAESIVEIVLMLLLPFIVGQALRNRVLPITAKISRIDLFDKTVIVLVVYAAFSEGVVDGVWSMIGISELVWLTVACCVLLAVVLGLTELTARLLGFDVRDKRVVQFCGSKKSLATGLPMAAVLFAGQPVGMLVLPLMLFHQIQLIVCAWLAARYGREESAAAPAATCAGSPARSTTCSGPPSRGPSATRTANPAPAASATPIHTGYSRRPHRLAMTAPTSAPAVLTSRSVTSEFPRARTYWSVSTAALITAPQATTTRTGLARCSTRMKSSTPSGTKNARLPRASKSGPNQDCASRNCAKGTHSTERPRCAAGTLRGTIAQDAWSMVTALTSDA